MKSPTAPMMKYCLETTDLCHRFTREDPVLRGIDLQVREGSIYGFLGPNGAGKTTTLRLLLGLLKLQHGSVTIFGREFRRHRMEVLRRIGSFVESPSLYDHLTAWENLRVWQLIYRCPRERIEEVLGLVGLGHTGQKKIRQFSLGMKQRLSIAVALFSQPALLILDEPTNGLDPAGIIEMRELLLRLNRERRVTMIISSHLLAEIEKLATHLGIIHRGRIVFQGTKEELRRQRCEIASVSFATGDDVKALAVIGRLQPSAKRVKDGVVVPPLSNEEIADATRALVNAGVAVHEIRQDRHDLEAIFMDLIEEKSP